MQTDKRVIEEALLKSGKPITKSSLHDLSLTKVDIELVLQFLAYICETFNIYFLFKPNLNDEDDDIFVELAFCSNSEYLITNNVRDIKNSELKFDSFQVVTPSQFVKFWRKN